MPLIHSSSSWPTAPYGAFRPYGFHPRFKILPFRTSLNFKVVLISSFKVSMSV